MVGCTHLRLPVSVQAEVPWLLQAWEVASGLEHVCVHWSELSARVLRDPSSHPPVSSLVGPLSAFGSSSPKCSPKHYSPWI